MADHDKRRFLGLRVEPGKLGGYGSHGDQLSTGNAGDLELRGLPNVDKRELVAELQPALDFLGSDFEG